MGNFKDDVAPETENTLPASFVFNIANAGPGSIIVFDTDTFDIVFCNQEFFRYFGYEEEDIYHKRKKFTDLIPAYQIPFLKSHISTVAADFDKRNKYVIYRIRNARGQHSLFYTYISSYEIKEHNRNYTQVLLLPELSQKPLPFISFDSREAFLELFTHIGFGTYEWMLDSNEFFWSDGVYNIYEVDKSIQSIKADDVFAYTHPDDMESMKSAMAKAIETSTPFEIEKRIIVNGKVKTLLVNGEVFCDVKNVPIKVAGCKRDITEQRRIEAELQEKVIELNESNQDLESFAYIASHDLQEPLRKISTFCSRIADKYTSQLDDEGKMYISRVLASADSMRNLIDSLLEFSRVTKSKQPFSSVDLSFVLRQVLSELEISIEETGAVIEYNDLPEVECQMSQMKQLFSNLVNNSIKFRKKEVKPHIVVSSSLLSNDAKISYGLNPDSKYYEIAVKDNGIGFEDEYSAKVFQIFQRLNGKSEYPGSGIGLAICKKIVDHHNGIIVANGVPGEGAVFTIVLPEKHTEI
jgi:light-regulated signal transduction histidine kinase (bacteriophytochrome)